MVSTDALLLDGADQPASSAINVFVTGQPGLFDYYANHHSYCAIFSSLLFIFGCLLIVLCFFFGGEAGFRARVLVQVLLGLINV